MWYTVYRLNIGVLTRSVIFLLCFRSTFQGWKQNDYLFHHFVYSKLKLEDGGNTCWNITSAEYHRRNIWVMLSNIYNPSISSLSFKEVNIYMYMHVYVYKTYMYICICVIYIYTYIISFTYYIYLLYLLYMYIFIHLVLCVAHSK